MGVYMEGHVSVFSSVSKCPSSKVDVSMFVFVHPCEHILEVKTVNDMCK